MTQAILSKPGTLVHARGREWVVLPESTDELLMLRPVGGLDEEVTGVLPAVEPIESATFRLPSPGRPRRLRFRPPPFGMPPASRPGPPQAPSAASGASPSSRGPTSSCR